VEDAGLEDTVRFPAQEITPIEYGVPA